MGFFSLDCKVCGHPMLSPSALEKKNGWMNDAVVIIPKGSILKGEYDGYGRVDGIDALGGDVGYSECYHQKCWELAGKPIDFTEASQNSEDQGWFFDDGVHNHPEPKTLKEAQRLRDQHGKNR